MEGSCQETARPHSAGFRSVAMDRMPVTCALPKPVFRVTDLCVWTGRQGQGTPLLQGISFELYSGRITGVLGESGAGKSTMALALIHLLPPCFRAETAEMELDGQRLESLPERAWEAIRGARISLVHQDGASLNPVMRCGDQVAEVLRAHGYGPSKECRREARELLRAVGLEDDRIYRAHPHQLSGGQKQRILIAQAIACRPAIVIADEPTAALDGRSAREVLLLLKELTVRSNSALLLITHQPAVIAEFADRVMVLYHGQMVEEGTVGDLLSSPLHPYTRQLLDCQHPLEGNPGVQKDTEPAKPRWPTIRRESLDSNMSSAHYSPKNLVTAEADFCAVGTAAIGYPAGDGCRQVEGREPRR